MRFGYDLAGKSNSVTWLFKGPTERTGHRRNRGVLQEQHPYLRLNRFQGVRPSSRKDNSTPGTVRHCQVPLRYRARRPQGPTISQTRLGNINPIPFRHRPRKVAIPRAFASGLGSTDPHATAVHVEPLPTSVHKVPLVYLLLPPRSALMEALARSAPSPSTLTITTLLLVVAWHQHSASATTVGYKSVALAPSILRAS